MSGGNLPPPIIYLEIERSLLICRVCQVGIGPSNVHDHLSKHHSNLLSCADCRALTSLLSTCEALHPKDTLGIAAAQLKGHHPDIRTYHHFWAQSSMTSTNAHRLLARLTPSRSHPSMPASMTSLSHTLGLSIMHAASDSWLLPSIITLLAFVPHRIAGNRQFLTRPPIDRLVLPGPAPKNAFFATTNINHIAFRCVALYHHTASLPNPNAPLTASIDDKTSSY